jgi:hypothetical protein
VDVVLARVLSPFERAFGFTLLGAAMYNAVLNAGNMNGLGGFGGF